MLKKLLKIYLGIFSNKNQKDLIEEYLSKSKNSYDLECRIKELDKAGKYSKFYM
tara:strand:+ start:674 stop:835 length:162 start_codon:yes stop_codon:yes gene_type:complete